VVLLSAAGTLALWACGPYFPNWILGSDESFLTMPGGLLSQEVRLLKLPPDSFHAQPPAVEEDPFKQTANADAADLQKALAKSGLPPERAQAIAARHAELRNLLRQHAEAASTAPLPAGAIDPERLPEGLPGEFADYLQGAVAFHQGRLPDASAAWQRLLRRPAADRRLRSTWAAFMLGRVSQGSDPKEALHWFETTREMAAHGFEDSLGLAAASLGWQARAERDLGHFDRALVLYARQARTGDPLALSSIQHVSRQALEKGGDTLASVARSGEARDVMTAFLVSDRHGDWGADPWGTQAAEEEEAGAAPAPTAPADGIDPDVAAWLKAVKAAGVKEAAGAERLAWIAYQGGDFTAAHDWLQRAPEDAPMARWVRARLLLRDGKVAEAQKLVDEVARTLPAVEVGDDEIYRFGPESGLGKLATPSLAHAEDGALLLTQGKYTQALDHFLRGGFWLESGYVADRLLSLDELRAYVDSTWPANLAAGLPTIEEGNYLYASLETPKPGQLAHDLRYLLGRRLVRAGRYGDARPYLPADLHPLLDALAKATGDGRNTALPAEQRARALFQAACITRRQGLELIGSENEPDWKYLGADFELDAFPGDVARRADNKFLLPGPEEKERAERGKVEPWKRFHYRYRAAALAGEAAALLPDGSEDKARMLATAGSWLKLRDPQAAAPFYKSLVSCCRATPLGKEAERLRRLPEVPECEMGVAPLAQP
jgi:hypothetical protein